MAMMFCDDKLLASSLVVSFLSFFFVEFYVPCPLGRCLLIDTVAGSCGVRYISIYNKKSGDSREGARDGPVRGHRSYTAADLWPLSLSAMTGPAVW